MRLDLGCGKNKKRGYIGVDLVKTQGVDIIVDLNRTPYPFKDESVDEIFMRHVLEHLDNPKETLCECYRILKREGYLIITVPFAGHMGSYQFDHKWFFKARDFYFLDPDNDHHYYVVCKKINPKFKIVYVKYNCGISPKLLPIFVVGKIIEKILNKWGDRRIGKINIRGKFTNVI